MHGLLNMAVLHFGLLCGVRLGLLQHNQHMHMLVLCKDGLRVRCALPAVCSCTRPLAHRLEQDHTVPVPAGAGKPVPGAPGGQGSFTRESVQVTLVKQALGIKAFHLKACSITHAVQVFVRGPTFLMCQEAASATKSGSAAMQAVMRHRRCHLASRKGPEPGWLSAVLLEVTHALLVPPSN